MDVSDTDNTRVCFKYRVVNLNIRNVYLDCNTGSVNINFLRVLIFYGAFDMFEMWFYLFLKSEFNIFNEFIWYQFFMFHVFLLEN